MLVIRNEQMRALASARREAFVLALEAHVRRRFGLLPAVGDTLQVELRGAIEFAERHGIDLEEDIRRFVECFFSHGGTVAAVDATPWITEVLKRDDLDGTGKMNRIDDAELRQSRATPWHA